MTYRLAYGGTYLGHTALLRLPPASEVASLQLPASYIPAIAMSGSYKKIIAVSASYVPTIAKRGVVD